MKTKLLLTALIILCPFAFLLSPCTAQVPMGFNYQAIARNGSGLPITNQTLSVRISIVTSLTGGSVIWKEEHTDVAANANGLISMVVGTGTQTGGSASSFSSIDWGAQILYLKTEVKYPGPDWTEMGTSQIWAVPYSLVSQKVQGPLSKLGIAGTTDNMEEALFEVKNKTGNTVFAVYNEGIRAYVGNGSAKGVKGGFSVGGYDASKSNSVYDILVLSTDSARFYLDSKPQNGAKGVKGGFSVGGYDMTKGTTSDFLDVSFDNRGVINPSENRILWYPLKNAFLTGKVLIINKDSIGENSFSSGYESNAKGQYSQALGFKAKARGNYSTAIGNNAIASKTNSFAFGENAEARNEESYALGRGAIAEGWRSFAFGSAGIDSVGQTTGVAYAKGDYSFAIGQGSQALGKGAYALGLADSAVGDFSLAMGYKTKSAGWATTAMGSYTVAKGGTSTAMGWSTVADGPSATAMGANTSSLNENSTSMGFYTTAKGPNSTAMGASTIASGFSSTSLGYGSNASGWCSFATGGATKAAGGTSTTMGWGTIASGASSASMGANTIARGDNSTSMGFNTISRPYASLAIGYFNDTTCTSTTACTPTDPVFIIGKGTNNNNRSNAFTVLKNGNTAIGHASPTQMLDVNGNARFRNVGSGAFTYNLNITSDGTLTTSSSDIRMKNEITEISDALEKVLKLRGVTFTWKSDSARTRQIGMIAQEVEEVVPELVFTNPADGMKGINYSQSVSVLVEAVKEQQKIIDSQEKKIQDLETRLEKVEALIK